MQETWVSRYEMDGPGSLGKRKYANGEPHDGPTYQRSSGKIAALRVAGEANVPIHFDALPTAKHYERSYMHRDVVSHLAFASQTGYLVTASCDGYVKLWKKPDVAKSKGQSSTSEHIGGGLEFAKQWRAHVGPIQMLKVSADGKFATTSLTDHTIKVFDILSLDMMYFIDCDLVQKRRNNTLCYTEDVVILATEEETGSELSTKGPACKPASETSFSPQCIEWIPGLSYTAETCLLVSDSSTNRARIYVLGETDYRFDFETLHNAPIQLARYNPAYSCVISVDTLGGIEYWTIPSEENGEADVPNAIDFVKSETDLYVLQRRKTTAISLELAGDGSLFSIYSADHHVYIFEVSTGKLKHHWDESLAKIDDQVLNVPILHDIDMTDLARRLAREKTLDCGVTRFFCPNVLIDSSKRYALYSTIFGIKVVSLDSGKLVLVLGPSESSIRFAALSLLEGTPADPDPVLAATGFDSYRFYLFTTREPLGLLKKTTEQSRDVYNENPVSLSKRFLAKGVRPLANTFTNYRSASSVTLHTTKGDIVIALYPSLTPKTVHNFVSLCSTNYYNGIVFHRIIKGFMVQTGDPTGLGTGGSSVWGAPFEDEIVQELRHNRVGTVSMANAGPATNGSQFFITTSTEACTHLDGKHTVFGSVIKGMEVAKEIESVPTDSSDRPLEEVRIISTSIE